MRSTFDVWGTRTDLFAKTSSQDLYAMIDALMEKMDGLVRKHKGTSMVHRDDTVKTASGAACA
ncbi:MAG: HPF/RaiA family ribosome-associated protein [Hyphomonadaceae bacterium]